MTGSAKAALPMDGKQLVRVHKACPGDNRCRSSEVGQPGASARGANMHGGVRIYNVRLVLIGDMGRHKITAAQTNYYSHGQNALALST